MNKKTCTIIQNDKYLSSMTDKYSNDLDHFSLFYTLSLFLSVSLTLSYTKKDEYFLTLQQCWI